MTSFIWPLAFLLLPLPLVIRKWFPAKEQNPAGALKVPFFSQFQGMSDGTASAALPRWRSILLSLIWLLLVTAIARPVHLGKPVSLPAEGRDIMMAIDLSGSMEQTDFTIQGLPASRLDVLKLAADDFIDRRKGDRVGLILFSDRAYLQAPLTFDRVTVRELLDQAQVGLTGQKTAIGDAIAISVKRLKERPEQGRVLVLMTDGANNEGVMAPLKAAKIAKKLGIRIYTIGLGSESMPVQTLFGRQNINPSQDLDEGTLREIASETGGRYYRATDAANLAAIYADINKLEPVSSDPLYVRPQTALFYWPAGIAFALLILLAVFHSWTATRNSILSNTDFAGE